MRMVCEPVSCTPRASACSLTMLLSVSPAATVRVDGGALASTRLGGSSAAELPCSFWFRAKVSGSARRTC